MSGVETGTIDFRLFDEEFGENGVQQAGSVRVASAELSLRNMDAFLAANERRAYRMCLLATGEQADALDIVQDAMIKLVKNYAGGNPDEWPALFHRIVQNAIRDWHRKEKIRKKWRHWFSWGESEDNENTDNLEQQPQQGMHEPSELVNQTHTMQHLDEQINQLPLRQQQVFLLRQWEGLDVAQTAAAMGISEGSVKTHYSRAVHRLRETLKDFV